MSGAIRGALRSRRYAKRSIMTPSSPPPSIEQTSIRAMQKGEVDGERLRCPEDGHHPVADVGANHVDVAVGEVQELEDTVHHRVAERDQRIQRAVRDAGDQLGDEEVPVHPQSLRYRKRGAAASAAAPRHCDYATVLYSPLHDLEDVELGAGDVTIDGELERGHQDRGLQVRLGRTAP